MNNKSSNNYIEVLNSNMHVKISGEGDPILFIHGNPSNSFLWRNVTPHVEGLGQIIVPDLIGMGKSDKPDIDYSFDDQYKYLEALINKLELKNITLVVHDWGSGLGFNYFANHPENVKAIAFMEGILQDIGTFFPKENIEFFNMLRSEEGWNFIGGENKFLTDVFPTWSNRKLTIDEVKAYTAPFETIKSRKPIYKWVSEVPLNGKPEYMADLVKNYREKLQQSQIPKLFFYAEPGAFMPKPVADWVKSNLPNLKSVNIGEGVHFLQEDNPNLIGEELKSWLNELNT